jgi:RES domain-containing protein
MASTRRFTVRKFGTLNPFRWHCRSISFNRSDKRGFPRCRYTLAIASRTSGVIFRSVSPRYARLIDIVSGYGSYRGGGRWNAPGIYAIYGSIEPGLAADESFNFLLRHFGWQNRDIPPRMVVGIRVSLQAVLDLTNPESVLHQLNLEEFSEDWRKMNGEQKESCSQALGRAVADLGEGMLAPSRIRTGTNLVIYPRSLRTPDSLRVER